MPDQDVRLIFTGEHTGAVKSAKAVDTELKKISGTYDKSTKAVSNFGNQSATAFDKMRSSIMGFIGAVAIAKFFKDSFKAADEFNQKIAEITVMLGDVTPQSVDFLKDRINKLSVETGKFTGETAAGAWQLVSAFGEVALKGDLLSIAIKGATAGTATAAETVSLLSANMKGFGDMSDEMAKKIIDLALKTNDLGETSFKELAQNVTSAVPVFARLGGEIEELYAVYATLTGVTGNTSEVTTQLSSAMDALIKPTVSMKKIISELGYSSSEAMVKELGLVGAFQKIIGTTDGTMTSLGKLIRRKEGLIAVLSLTGTQSEDFRVKLDKLKDANGTTEKAFERMTQGVNKAGFEFQQAKVKIQVFMQGVGEILQQVVSGMIKYSDILIRVGVLIAGIFVINKLTIYFNMVATIFKNLSVGIKQTTIDIEKGTIVQAGAFNKLGTAIKNLPPAVKISLLLIGAEIAGRILENLFNQISQLQDEQIAMIIDTASQIEGEAHKITTEILAFRQAGEEYEAAFQQATKEVKEHILATDNVLIRQQKLKMWLEKLYPEWNKYKDIVKNIGAEKTTLNIKLTENIDKFNEIKKTIGSYTEKELKKYLSELEKNKVLTKKQTDELTDYWKEIDEARKKVESFAASMGILTSQGFVEQSKEINTLINLYDKNKDQIFSNEETLDKWIKKINELSKTALPEERKELEKIGQELDRLSLKKLPEITDKQREYTIALTTFNYATGEFQQVMPATLQIYDELTKKSGQVAKETDEVKKKTESLAQSFTSLSTTIGAVISFLDGLNINLGGFGDILKGASTGFNAIGAGLDAVKNASPGFTGFLQKASGYLGVVGGAVSIGIGLFKGLFKLLSGESGEMKAAKRALQGLGDAAASFAKQIEELAKKKGGAGSAEDAFNELFASIIDGTTITISNLDAFLQKIIEMPAVAMWSSVSMEKAAADMGKAFGAIQDDVIRLGQESSKAFLDIIRNSKNLGLNVKEISDYISGLLTTYTENWKKYVSTITLDTIGSDIKFIEQATLTMFAALQSEGMSYIDILKFIQPELANLADLAKQSGIEISDSLRNMLDISAFLEQNKTLADRIDSLQKMLKSLGDTAVYLTDVDFYNFSTEVKKQFDEIIAKTGDQNIAFQLLGPSFDSIIKFAESYGYVIDGNTAAIIDQYKLSSSYHGEEINYQERQIELLEKIVILLGGETDEIVKMRNISTTAADDMIDDMGDYRKSINQTTDSIVNMQNEIINTDKITSDVVSGHSMVSEFRDKLNPELRNTIGIIENIGNAIIGVDKDMWGNSVKNMTSRISDIQKEIDKLKDNIKKLTDEEKLYLEQLENELIILTDLQKKREDALQVSEDLSNVIFDINQFDIYTSQLNRIIDGFISGAITAKEFQNEVGNSFNTIIDAAKNLGIEGSSYILNFIKATRQMGIEIPEISKYIADQLKTGIESGLDKYLSAFVNPAEIQKTINELTEKLTGTKGKERKNILEEIEKQNRLLADSVTKVKENFESMGTYTMALFNSLIAEGATFNQAIQQMGPQLQKLADMARASGMEISGELKEVLNFSDFIEQNKTLFDQLDGLTQMLTALGNSGYLTADVFKTFEKDTKKLFDKLVSGADDSKQAYQAIAPQLGKLLWYSQQYGFSLDENTKALIKEAEAHGVNMAAMIPPEEKMVALLEAMLIAFGVDIPYAVENMTGTINDQLSKISMPVISPKLDVQGFKDVMKAIGGNVAKIGDTIKQKTIEEQIKMIGLKISETTRSIEVAKSAGMADVVKKLESELKKYQKILIDLKGKLPKFATGGIIKIPNIAGSATDSIPLNMLVSPGELVRIFSKKEVDIMKNRPDTGYYNKENNDYQNTTSYTRENITYNNKIQPIIYASRDESESNIARKIVNIFRNNKEGVVTEGIRQWDKRGA